MTNYSKQMSELDKNMLQAIYSDLEEALMAGPNSYAWCRVHSKYSFNVYMEHST